MNPAVLRGGGISLFIVAMTIRQRAQAWLKDRGSFLEGVQLLESEGGRNALRYAPILKQQFVSRADIERLRSDVVLLVGRLPADENPAAPTSPAPAAVPGRNGPQKVPDTPRITAIRNQQVMLHKQRSDLKSRLTARALDDPDNYTDAERYELAIEIMATVPALDELYDQTRRFEAEGIEPADDAQMIRRQTVAEMQERSNLRSKISRTKKLADKGDKAAIDELASYQERLEELNARLEL